MEKGIVTGFEHQMYNGQRSIWASSNGDMFAWIVRVDMNGNNVEGKVFTKNPDRFPVEVGTEIVFNTDWNTSRGPAYFKGVKDAAKEQQYAQNRGGGQQGGQPQGNTQRQDKPTPRPPVPVVPPNEDLHKEKMFVFAIKYLKFIKDYKEFAITSKTITDLALDSFSVWVKKYDNHARAERALRVAIETLDINELLVSNDLDIKSKDDLLALAGIYYESF